MLAYLNKTGVNPQEALYIGDTLYDRECAANAGVNFGLAVWGCHSIEQIHAIYYFETPKDLLNVL